MLVSASFPSFILHPSSFLDGLDAGTFTIEYRNLNPIGLPFGLP
jgi:hypothetical protein